MTKVLQENSGLGSKDPERFNGNGDKMVAVSKCLCRILYSVYFAFFFFFSALFATTCTSLVARLVYEGASVSGHPTPALSTSPRNNGGFIRSLAIQLIEACGFQMAGILQHQEPS